MANTYLQEIPGQGSQGIAAFNRVIIINWTDLVEDNARFSVSTKTGKGGGSAKGIREFKINTLKDVYIEEVVVRSKNLDFDGDRKPASVTVGLGKDGTAIAEDAAAKATYSGFVTGITGTIIKKAPTITTSYEASTNDKALVVYVATNANDKDLTTAKKGVIKVYLRILAGKDLDAMADTPSYSGR